MHIGIDFDNTIITYDNVFYKYALKSGLIPKEVKKNKQTIRDTIRMLPEGNDRWTELQGLVYGCYMDEAMPTKGVEHFLLACRKHSAKVSIISHKTIYPAMGPQIDLQAVSKRWLESRNFLSKFNLTKDDIIFKETLQGKLDQIAKRGCTCFIDDLTEVLMHPDFPGRVKKILYSQQISQVLPEDITHFEDWDEITEHLFS